MAGSSAARSGIITGRIRWIARGISLFVAAVWVFMGIVPAFIESPAWTFE